MSTNKFEFELLFGIVKWLCSSFIDSIFFFFFFRKLINLLNFNKNEDNMFYVSQLDRVSMEKK